MKTESFNIPFTQETFKASSFAIDFALRELEAFEVLPILSDCKADQDLAHWLQGPNEVRDDPAKELVSTTRPESVPL